MNNKKIFMVIILVLLIIVSVVGITYAAYTWGVDMDINGAGECFDVVYVKGRDIGSNESSKTLMVGRDYSSGLSSTVEVKLSDVCNVSSGSGTLYLTTDSTTSSELLSSGVLKYQIIDGNILVDSGTINSTGKVKIYEDFDVTKNDKALIVFVWIDGEMVTQDNYETIKSSSYSGSISVEVESR